MFFVFIRLFTPEASNIILFYNNVIPNAERNLTLTKQHSIKNCVYQKKFRNLQPQNKIQIFIIQTSTL